ncbi:MAG: hypothetical protein RLY20_1534 [Verrucomicrobiota bacterium]
MSGDDSNFYARWRQQCGLVPTLHEITEPPPERLLQAIWQQQRLRRDDLRTLDGRPVRILHPGFHNAEGGPDFRNAVVQFDDAPPATGDIEVDLQTSGWHAHGHATNPNFKSVILHVVWSAPKKPSATPPAITISNRLDAPLAELATWLGGETAPPLPEAFRGRCAAPLRELDETSLLELLRQAALVRLAGKAAQFAARARESGWEQSLWEGLFRALGYKHNTWPMQRLAELRPRWTEGAGSATELQARLLGLANLLPTELTRAELGADHFLRQLWDIWWRARDTFEDCQLPRTLWRLHGIRPLNHPQRRLALAAHWAAEKQLIPRLEDWGIAIAASPQSAAEPSRKVPSSAKSPLRLLEILHPPRDDFWSHHFTLRSARCAKPQLLLGEARVTDLAINVILPWLHARAKEGRNTALQAALESSYSYWPAAEDNATLKLARQRLLGSTSGKLFSTAAAQQGLLQIVRDFCDHSNAICDACRFPELVRAWSLKPTDR